MNVKFIDIHNVCFDVKSKNEKLITVISYLKTKFSITNNTAEEQDLKRYVQQTFFPKYFNKWVSAHRDNTKFLNKNNDWLNTHITLTEIIKNNPESSVSNSNLEKKPCDDDNFINLSERSKKRKVEKICSYNSSMICYVTALNLKKEGKKSASKIVKKVTLQSPTRADHILETFNTPNKPQVITLTPDEALS